MQALKWRKWVEAMGGSSASSDAQEVQVVRSDHYQTKIVVSGAESTSDPHEDSRVGNNFDEESLGGSTKRIMHTQRALFFASISTTLLLIVIIILSVGLSNDLFRNTPDPARNPGIYSNLTSSEDLAERIYEYLITVAENGAEGFNDPVSPESQALAWMQYEDTLFLDPNDPDKQDRIGQRFALLTLWFQSEYDWFGQNNWLSGNECSWEGVNCVRDPRLGNGVVRKLSLAQYNLQGNLSPNLHLLKNLTSLDLSRNQIRGEIPKTFSSMSSLEELYLHDNFLSQGISLDFSRMSNLVDVNLSNNRFEGIIPTSLYKVSSIGRIQLDNNIFSGIISDDIGDLNNLCKRNTQLQTSDLLTLFIRMKTIAHDILFSFLPDRFCRHVHCGW